MGTQETNTPTSTTIKVHGRNVYTYPKPPPKTPLHSLRDDRLNMSGGKNL